jgi:hypothetical protein
MKITKTTIRRCVRCLIPDSNKSRETGDEKEDELIKIVKDKYFNFSTVGERLNEFSNSYKEIMKPIEPTCDAYFTNLKEHIKSNFSKYQKRYLQSNLKSYCQDNNCDISVSNIKFMIYAVQQKVNGNIDYSYRVEKRTSKYAKLADHIKVDKFIEIESQILKNNITTDINVTGELKVNKRNIFHYLKYFFHIENELIKRSIKRILILPHFVPKVRYIRWESRPLSQVYNIWKSVTEKLHKDINIEDFEKNFATYYPKMFPGILKKYKKMLKRYPIIRSIATNGYSVSIGFIKLKKKETTLPSTNNVVVNDIDNKIIDENNNTDINETLAQSENEIKPKSIAKKTKNPIIIKKLEDEYPKVINKNGKMFKEAMYEATEIQTTEQFLEKFYVAGADPGNYVMFDITAENGLHTVINKNYYNDIAHVTRNKKIIDEEIEKNKMDEVYADMSLENTKTTKIEEYMKYVEIVRKNWDRIWKFCTKTSVLELSMDSYTHKKKAVNRIAKEICTKIKDKNSIYPRQKGYFDEDKYNKDKDKPILIAMGKGNGNMTISNTKGSSAKGPIKSIVKELSKYCVVLLTPEDNTSQLCNICKEQISHVKVCKTKSKKEIEKMNKEEREIEKIKNESTKDLRQRIKNIKFEQKIIKGMIEEGLMLKDVWEIGERMKEKYKEELEEYREIYSESYRLVCCANKEHKHKMWERNMNGSKNMTEIMKNIVVKKDKGKYTKKKKIENKTEKENKGKKKDENKIEEKNTEMKVIKSKIKENQKKKEEKNTEMKVIKSKIKENQKKKEENKITDKKTKIIVKGKRKKEEKSFMEKMDEMYNSEYKELKRSEEIERVARDHQMTEGSPIL